MSSKFARRTFLKGGVGLGAGAMAASPGTQGAAAARTGGNRPPNIVFVLVDDMRWDQLSLVGHPFVQTPNIDRIGAEGVLFENSYAITPLCSPSRASTLTGQYPHTNRIINNDRNGLSFISHKLVTFPQLLRRAGYETAFIGKWHMGDDDTRRPGFDHWISFRGQGLYVDPVVNVNDKREQFTGYMTDMLNDWSVDFVKQERDKPFLLYLSHKAVHEPFIPAERHQDLYADQRYSPPPVDEADLAGKPALQRDILPADPKFIPGATPEPAEPRLGRGTSQQALYLDYFRSLASVDEGVGMLFEALEETGQLDDTLFIFTSDNGFTLGEHGEFMNKRIAYEESLRVPLLMRYPRRIAPGSTRGQFALNLDIAPTLYDLAGVTPPVPIHGQSLWPVVDDADAEFRKEFLAEYFLEKVSPLHETWQTVRTERYKYIHYPDLQGMDELYDLQEDPKEQVNRLHSAEYHPVLRQMQDKLAELLRTTGA